jgi:hypothetical protein
MKSPLNGGLVSNFVIPSPSNPHGTSVQMLDVNTACLSDLLNDLMPGFEAFIVLAVHGYDLDLLYVQRCDKALNSANHKFVGFLGVDRRRGGRGHRCFLTYTVVMYSIAIVMIWQYASQA